MNSLICQQELNNEYQNEKGELERMHELLKKLMVERVLEENKSK